MICKLCQKEYEKGWGEFCSHACQARYAFKIASEVSNKARKDAADKKKNDEMNKTHVCERCGVTYVRKDGISARFCSRKCANSRVRTEETKKRISASLKARYFYRKRYCRVCGAELHRQTEGDLCGKCIKHDEHHRKKLSEIAKKNMAIGKIKPWNSRNIKSYAERFWETVLLNNDIKYEREKHVGRYFLDFVMGFVDLEIDGKQHEYDDRKKSDEERDAYLTSIGYSVYRIKWNEVNTDEGKAEMKKKIDAFLSYLNEHKGLCECCSSGDDTSKPVQGISFWASAVA